ncbi:regulatory TetR family protein [Mumia flava]|uniref:Regulatory TetR family protein n=1 Tax=Mumia flava TaxID=1348852 RepID=A0A2M9B7W0_9ACTN|nr:TetR/AcrR family transcriptional regulator [Mumia flava]PJJ54012.1 regulatory TetR family protein [Mumia flava]
MRRDAVRNRERLLDEAEVLFELRGAAVALDEVARRAQVSSATLYRHFPDRESLVRALTARVAARADAIAAEADWEGPADEAVVLLVTRLSEALVSVPGSHAILRAMQTYDPEYVPGARFVPPFTELVMRARADGFLHPRATASDLVGVAMMVGAVASVSPLLRDGGGWRRYVAIGLAGLRAGAPLDETAALVAD